MSIQQFNLGGGASPASPQDVYPLMERMIASMDSAAERIGGNIRQSMMQNQANEQGKAMANDAQQLLQNPKATSDPNILAIGMMQLGSKYPLALQGQQGHTIMNVLGSRVASMVQMPVAVNPNTGQPMGSQSFDASASGVGQGVTPSGNNPPSGMIPTNSNSGPAAQPQVQVNGKVQKNAGEANPLFDQNPLPDKSGQQSTGVDTFTPIESQYKDRYQQAIATLKTYPAGYKQNNEIRKQAETDMREAQTGIRDIAVKRADLTEQNKKETDKVTNQDRNYDLKVKAQDDRQESIDNLQKWRDAVTTDKEAARRTALVNQRVTQHIQAAKLDMASFQNQSNQLARQMAQIQKEIDAKETYINGISDANLPPEQKASLTKYVATLQTQLDGLQNKKDKVDGKITDMQSQIQDWQTIVTPDAPDPTSDAAGGSTKTFSTAADAQAAAQAGQIKAGDTITVAGQRGTWH